MWHAPAGHVQYHFTRVAVITLIFARLALLCVLLNGLSALAQSTPLQVRPGTQSIDLTTDGLVLEDPDGNLSLDEVRSPSVASRFTRASTSGSFGGGKGSVSISTHCSASPGTSMPSQKLCEPTSTERG